MLAALIEEYEEEGFGEGTKDILMAAANSNGKSVLGGGDAISSSEYFNIKDFTFISTGGGASLEYIANGYMACMKELN